MNYKIEYRCDNCDKNVSCIYEYRKCLDCGHEIVKVKVPKPAPHDFYGMGWTGKLQEEC
jgi:DNA-directed RNA polymerase subunit RPC12/RpoP